MLGAVFSAVAGFIYKHHKSRKTAILGAVAGAAAMALFSVPSNYFITYPAYVEFYHMPLEAILGMYQAILPLPTAHEVPRHLQPALHAGQGSAGRRALHDHL